MSEQSPPTIARYLLAGLAAVTLVALLPDGELQARGSKGKAKGFQMKDSKKVPVGNSPVRGPDDAAVTIVEWADFQCPYCRKSKGTLAKLRRNYPDEVRVVFKHFPLPFHKKADEAAYAALAAAEQGEFWAMHDRIFENPKKLKGADIEQLTAGWAKQMGLDVAQFKKDFNQPKKWDRVIERDKQLGKKLGVKGTPHFLVNGEKVSGAQPYTKFKSVVEAKLDQAERLEKNGVSAENVYRKAVQKNYDKPSEPKPKKKKKQKVEYVPVDKDTPVRGAEDDYLVTIVMFSDFQCPFCNKAVPTIEKVVENFGDRVRVAFRHRPLQFHKHARPAGRAAWAAQQQGEFWAMHDLLFENQKKLSGSLGTYAGFAKQLGLDVAQFKKNYKSQKAKNRIDADIDVADDVGARGTPNFFVNGVNVVGAQPYSRFKSEIEEQIELAETIREDSSEEMSAKRLYKEAVKANKDSAEEEAESDDGGSDNDKKKKEIKRVDREKLGVGTSPVKGPMDAEVTIYEFSDFQCPYCAKARKTLQKVLEDYDGRVRLVHKDYPLPFHKRADEAARAAWAAQQQGEFWAMYDLLFENQEKLDENGIFVGFAEKLDLNVDEFKADMNKAKAASQFKQDMKLGKEVGVRGTPAFFINGYRVVGAQPASKFRKIIDKALEETEDK